MRGAGLSERGPVHRQKERARSRQRFLLRVSGRFQRIEVREQRQRVRRRRLHRQQNLRRFGEFLQISLKSYLSRKSDHSGIVV